MRRLLIIIATLLLILSCTTPSEIADEYIREGTRYAGLEAAEIYERGLNKGDAFSLYYNLAYSYLEAGDYEKAMATADEALELYPEALRFLYLKAYILREEHRYYSYENTLKEILAFDEGNETIRSTLLAHYNAFGRAKDAEAVAREILRHDPKNQEALRTLSSSSEFFKAIAPSGSNAPVRKDDEKSWTVPPELYMPLEILNEHSKAASDAAADSTP